MVVEVAGGLAGLRVQGLTGVEGRLEWMRQVDDVRHQVQEEPRVEREASGEGTRRTAASRAGGERGVKRRWG